MLLFKKNSWFLFYLIALIGIGLLASVVYQKYEEISTTKQNQLYLTKLHQERLNSLLNEHELLLNLLANQYQLHTNSNRQTFNHALELNPLLVDIEIFSNDGKLQLSTLIDKNTTNQLHSEATRQWVTAALNSNKMVIGRAYLREDIHKWILPIRKKFIDTKNHNSIIISTEFDLTKLNKRWNKDSGANTIQAILDNGAFPILRTDLKTEQYSEFYKQPLVNGIFLRQNLKQLNTKVGTDSEAYIQKIKTLTTQKVLFTFSYNKQYGFWVSTEILFDHILNKLNQYSVPYFIFYLLIIALIFALFYWINSIEKAKINELTHKAEYDTLTGLPKRTFISKYFHKLQSSQETPFALLYLDLDNFKNINDMFGHSYGDLLLIEVTKRITQSLVHHQGVATRYSGDEFVILLEFQNREEIVQYAKLLLKSLALPYLINQNIFKISASIGISLFPDDTSDIETLLSYADNSMYAAKKKKSHYFFFSKEQHTQSIRNIEIEQALHRAIVHDEISLVYQPQLDKDGQLLGVEALVRWNCAKLGFITPDIFIPIAEETGLMPKLGLYIIHKAMKEIDTLKRQQGLDFRLSINVSVRQFVQIDFIEKLMQACTYHSTDQTTITIEITESLFIESLDTLLPLFYKMKANSISLSLDDFGTGYSSLSMLRKAPIDELKIDKSFVDHIASNKTDRAMVKNIIRMGKELGMIVLAEGVETQEQIEILQQADCDIFQGYYFAKPLPLNELAGFAKKHQKKKVK
jgi:diguanylate cyclase (GGDEF)-like protein